MRCQRVVLRGTFASDSAVFPMGVFLEAVRSLLFPQGLPNLEHLAFLCFLLFKDGQNSGIFLFISAVSVTLVSGCVLHKSETRVFFRNDQHKKPQRGLSDNIG